MTRHRVHRRIGAHQSGFLSTSNRLAALSRGSVLPASKALPCLVLAKLSALLRIDAMNLRAPGTSKVSSAIAEAGSVMVSAASAGASDRTKAKTGRRIDFINTDYRFDLLE